MSQTKVELGLDVKALSTITTADNTDTLSLISTDADANSGPNLLLDRNSSSTANQDVIGVITYRGRNDAGQEVDYVQLESRLGDETDGTEDANFKLKHMNAGTLREYISTNHAEICLNEEFGVRFVFFFFLNLNFKTTNTLSVITNFFTFNLYMHRPTVITNLLPICYQSVLICANLC